MRLILTHRGEKRVIGLEEGATLVLGRDEDCGVRVDSHRISRKHCELSLKGGAASVLDLSSKNGTFVNGERIREQRILKDGDELLIGRSVKIRVLSADEARTAAQPEKAKEAEPGAAAAHVHRDETPTPVDQNFAPQEPSVRAASPAAQAAEPSVAIVARGNEVRAIEAAEPALDSLPERPQPPWVKTAIRAGLVMVPLLVLIATAVKLSGQRGTEPPPQPAMNYTENLNRGVELFFQGKYGEMDELLEQAAALPNQGETAQILRDFGALFSEAEKDLTKLNWRRAEALAKELASAQPTTAKVTGLAQDRLAWLRREEQATARICAIKELAEKGHWASAVEEKEKLPKESAAATQNGEFLAKVETEYQAGLLRSADAEFGSGKWEEARKIYEQLIARLPLEAQAPLREKTAVCERRKRDSDALKQGKALASSDRAEEAMRILDGIEEDSPFRAEARQITGKLVNDAHLRQARVLYNAGKGREAMSYLDKNRPEGWEGLSRQVETVLNAHTRGLAALEKRELEKAANTFMSVVDLENTKGNFFHDDAEEKGRLWGAPAARARAYKAWGDSSYKEGRLQEARAYYEKANSTQPSIAAEEMRQMHLRAVRVWNSVINPGEKTKEELKPMVIEVISLLSPTEALCEEAKKKLAELEKEKK